MNINDLPDDKKFYTVCMSNKHEYSISGVERTIILGVDNPMIEMKNGEVINKSHIVDIVFDKEKTKNEYYKSKNLPE